MAANDPAPAPRPQQQTTNPANPPDLVLTDILTTEDNTSMYTWTINNFTSCSEKVRSPTFSTGSYDLKWCLEVCPKRKNQSSQEYVSICLRLESDYKSEVDVKVDLSINSKSCMANTCQKPIRKFNHDERVSWGCLKYIKRENLIRLPEDKLTIWCLLSIRTKLYLRSVSDEVGSLFKEMKLMEPPLVVCKGFEANKDMLKARNETFAALFERDMTVHDVCMEVQNNVTDEINDDLDDYAILALILILIYSTRAPNLDNMAGRLLVAADMHELPHIKEMGEMILDRNLCVETAADTLVLAELHSAGWLKSQTIAFIVSNGTKVMETAGWKNLISSHSNLVAEVLRVFADQEITKM